jgi:hypothetical protein
MHTDHTLTMLEGLTTTLGDQLRFFANETCSSYETFELPREAAARQRRQSKKPQVNVSDADPKPRRRKTFHMNTYKHHALGDYVETIRNYGTCDSYSTELVCKFFFVDRQLRTYSYFSGRVGASHIEIAVSSH